MGKTVILEHPLISDISDFITQNDNISKLQPLRHVLQADYYSVSSAQKRIYFAVSEIR